MATIIKALINGAVSIVKLIIVLYALYYTVDSGLLDKLINMF